MSTENHSTAKEIMAQAAQEVETNNLLSDALNDADQTPYSAQVRDLADELMRQAYPDTIFFEDLSYEIRQRFLEDARSRIEV